MKKERAEVDILGRRQKDEKCVLFEEPPCPAVRGTIYWERDQQDNKFLSLYAHAWKITKVDNERNPNVKRGPETQNIFTTK